MTIPRVGWRLTFEPIGESLAWSLIRIDDDHPQGRVWAGVHDAIGQVRADVLALHPVRSGGNPWDSPLADPQAEEHCAVSLGRALLPEPLRRALVSELSRHTLTIATRSWPTAVPWCALALDETGTRLVERCRVIGGLPPGMVSGLEPVIEGDGPPLWVVDPGPIASSGGFPPLYPDGYPEELMAAAKSACAALVPDSGTFTVDDLSVYLGGRQPSRWLYLGHISHGSAMSPAAVGLVLRRGPLTAHDWLAEPGRWPAPSRVGLVGCAGDDAQDLELTGLVAAALTAGARMVLTTRWFVPGDRQDALGTTRLAVAADRALSDDDPVEALTAWQRVELGRWRSTGVLDASPLLWAALVLYDESRR